MDSAHCPPGRAPCPVSNPWGSGAFSVRFRSYCYLHSDPDRDTSVLTWGPCLQLSTDQLLNGFYVFLDEVRSTSFAFFLGEVWDRAVVNRNVFSSTGCREECEFLLTAPSVLLDNHAYSYCLLFP